MTQAPVCDLVLLSWNHLEETKPCLDSLFRHTDVSCRLFIVDNGSEPDVREFLKTVRPQGQILEVTLLQNEANEGFPKGMNRGLRASTAPFACILNNDLVFAPQWLSRMLEVAKVHPEIGVLNPGSSTFGEHPPRGMSLDDYAVTIGPKRGLYTEVGMCIGFCMIITRELITRVGCLSEEVERIFFEDEDYCMRAQHAGFHCVVVASSYVLHHEHRTVKKMGERERIFQRNQRWCQARWGKWLRIASPRWQPMEPGSEELHAWLALRIQWARRRTHVYVYGSWPADCTAEQLFRSVGLVPHADVILIRMPAVITALAATGLMLARRKKRFDAIVAPDAAWAWLMRRLRWAHGAQVVSDHDTEALGRVWHTRPPLPSLS